MAVFNSFNIIANNFKPRNWLYAVGSRLNMKMTPVFLVIFVFSVWVISGFVLYDVENRGTFGDMFGAINSLFSGLAFAGVVYAILLQQ